MAKATKRKATRPASRACLLCVLNGTTGTTANVFN